MKSGLSQQPGTFVRANDVYIRSFVGSISPQWHSRLLLAVEPWDGKDLRITAIDGEGLTEQIPFDLPGGAWIETFAIGSGPDRSIVYSGVAINGDSRGAPFIAWISPDRKRRVVIRTEKFVAWAVTVAVDGVIWAAGQEAQDADFRNIASNLFRRFSTSGENLGGFAVPQAAMKSPRLGNATENSRLLPSADGVGWFTNGNEYYEFSLTGTLVRQFDGPPGLDFYHNFEGVGLSSANELVVGMQGADGTSDMILNRREKSWAPLALTGEAIPGWNKVLGFDGDSLVTKSGSGILHRFRPGGNP